MVLIHVIGKDWETVPALTEPSLTLPKEEQIQKADFPPTQPLW